MLNAPLVQVQWGGHEMDTSPMSTEADRYIVESRYGQLTFEPAQVITLGRPVLGFPHLSQFGLTKLSGSGEAAAGNFVLLQSLEDAGISFPTIALDLKNTLIAEADIMATYTELGITPADGAVLCIITVREENGKDIVTANLRAPIFVDTAKKQGWQVVLNNPTYQIRHQI